MNIREDEKVIYIDLTRQILELKRGDESLFDAKISSAKNGSGELEGSEKTPRGWHIVRAKIGDGQPENTVFLGRRPTSEVYTETLGSAHPQRDWILTRIMWLSGLEPGFNRMGNVDTMRRYIYIHGCPDTETVGVPGSHGCIRMRNTDIIDLFDRTDIGTKVLIKE